MSTRNFILFFLCLIISNNAFGKFSNESWIYEKIKALENSVQRAGCQKYLAHGYRYEHMYDIEGMAFDNTVVETYNGDLTHFKMHLAIKAAKDGIILLSPKSNPGANDLVFEIGVGIAGNTFTVLRVTKDSSNEVARVNTSNILSTAHYTNFYINISDDVLTFGKVDDDSPIINYSDIRLRTVKYFDVSSWGVIDGKFLYDCPAITKSTEDVNILRYLLLSNIYTYRK